MPADTWPMLVAAGYLRRGLPVVEVARRTRLPVPQVRAIAGRLSAAVVRAAGGGQ